MEKSTRENKMRKIIIGIPNCQKCKMLMAQCPDAEHIELQPAELLQFARATGIQSMPFVVITEPTAEVLK
jgi:hypothetical protein